MHLTKTSHNTFIEIKYLNKNAITPKYQTLNSAGMDLSYSGEEDIVIKPNERVLVGTGLIVALPIGYEAQIRPRSGLSLKHGITIPNSPGTIDADYRGEVKVILMNLGQEDFTVKKGMRIAQMVVSQYVHVNIIETHILNDTERGEGGFGSTGD